MKICRITGSLAKAVSPRSALCVGRSRHPITSCPPAATISSMRFSHAERCAASGGRNTMPTPYSPALGRWMPHSSLAMSTRNPCGICISKPAPSPVLVSHPRAPRWSRLHKTESACSTIWWDLRPLIWATKPMPQASCSLRGSYKPCLCGYPAIYFLSELGREHAAGKRSGGITRGKRGLVYIIERKLSRGFGPRGSPNGANKRAVTSNDTPLLAIRYPP